MSKADTKATLKDALCAALPIGCNASIRYVHSRSRKCEPLFSPLPNYLPEKTWSTSHFLTVGIDDAIGHVLVYAIEVLVYSTSKLTTLFVSKADSTGYLPRSAISPIRTVSTTFLRWLSDCERRRSPKRQQVISLFGRAQGQYLFPGSAENSGKHVLDDRQLIRWWVKVLDPLFSDSGLQRRGFITVPGYSGPELRQFLPPAREHWTAGQPLREIARTRDVPDHAPTRCLLPRFPDDPKARFMQDLDDEVGLNGDAGASAVTSPSKRRNGRWKVIHDLDRFWEAMEFRQECSSGRMVGFLWVVTAEEPKSNLQSSQSSLLSSSQPVSTAAPSDSAPTKAKVIKKKLKWQQKLKGPIKTRKARIKGSSRSNTETDDNHFDGESVRLTADGYEQAMQTLLHLDFANIGVAVKSTGKWVAEVATMCRLPKQSWTMIVRGTAQASVVNGVQKPSGQVNDLGTMIRKKKRPVDDQLNNAVAQSEAIMTPLITTLGNGVIRKKPKKID